MKLGIAAEAKPILDTLRALASRGPDSAINMQLLAKINDLQRLLARY
jgi:hypothetical protein